MLKKMIIKKIAVASSIILVMLLLYLIPSNKEDISKNTKLEYIFPNDLEAIYLLGENNYLTRTKISVNNKDELSKTVDLVELLTIGGKKKDIIPNGFKALLPQNTRIIDLNLKEGILTIDFSQEFLNVKKENEEKLIEALTYTLTSIAGINKIAIYVEHKKLTKLPNSGDLLPEYLDKNYGINKEYEITNVSNIDSYTIYYVFNINDEVYYTPVTKYINNKNQDKVRIIIDELSSSLLYETNLMSYLDTNVKLLDYEITDKVIKLNFNDSILSDITNNKILEEVMYTIGLSICDELSVDDVVFKVNNQEISTFFSKKA